MFEFHLKKLSVLQLKYIDNRNEIEKKFLGISKSVWKFTSLGLRDWRKYLTLINISSYQWGIFMVKKKIRWSNDHIIFIIGILYWKRWSLHWNRVLVILWRSMVTEYLAGLGAICQPLQLWKETAYKSTPPHTTNHLQPPPHPHPKPTQPHNPNPSPHPPTPWTRLNLCINTVLRNSYINVDTRPLHMTVPTTTIYQACLLSKARLMGCLNRTGV